MRKTYVTMGLLLVAAMLLTTLPALACNGGGGGSGGSSGGSAGGGEGSQSESSTPPTGFTPSTESGFEGSEGTEGGTGLGGITISTDHDEVERQADADRQRQLEGEVGEEIERDLEEQLEWQEQQEEDELQEEWDEERAEERRQQQQEERERAEQEAIEKRARQDAVKQFLERLDPATEAMIKRDFPSWETQEQAIELVGERIAIDRAQRDLRPEDYNQMRNEISQRYSDLQMQAAAQRVQETYNFVEGVGVNAGTAMIGGAAGTGLSIAYNYNSGGAVGVESGLMADQASDGIQRAIGPAGPIMAPLVDAVTQEAFAAFVKDRDRRRDALVQSLEDKKKDPAK